MKRFVMVLIVMLVFCGAMLGFSCGHDEVYTAIIVEPSCVGAGQEGVICKECEEVINITTVEAVGHNYGNYVITKAPSAGKNGIEVGVCSVCGEEDQREYLCPHGSISTYTVKEPTCGEEGQVNESCVTCGTVLKTQTLETLPHEATRTDLVKEPCCYEEGLLATICEKCGQTVSEETVPRLECDFSEWIYVKFATPFDVGERYKECSECGEKEQEFYEIEIKGNSIYIPGTKIDKSFYVGEFTQEDVDHTDILYTVNAYNVTDTANPFILGHNYGSLGDLHNVEVGQNIYISVNGRVETYEVIVSEYAIEYNGVQIIGQTTGVNIWDTYTSALRSNYAVYEMRHGGVDRSEDNSGKTLHMYTCHGSDGGRWIVLAVLVQ